MAGMLELRQASLEDIKEKVKISTNYRAVLRLFDINIKHKPAKEYIIKYVKDNNIDASHFSKAGKSVQNVYPKEQVLEAVNVSICWTDLLRYFNRNPKGNNLTTFKKLVEFYNIDVSHFDTRKAISLANRSQVEFSFIENSSINRSSIKRYIIKNNLIEYKCKKCGLGEIWNHEKIVLQLEHMNGIPDDNRLENLCFLCPNCHSQTSTFGTKKRKLNQNS